ncbi:mitochondrial carrier domain-containing protein [Dimargaris cristalligena]|uniref:Mitochondrial carrier domain-containing protein n=1 Tax=Dimargaris cristalligena TaxID=215637 RepID=A0A4P9ZQR1_9FUNG|nr:mitochondrial carrier domain-containing protein [Dimargaris cristalligena]|eukprot:RKP35655.1 mitochondrial carrier domain-containing protein [Dimargaris cristalligena]
MVSKTRSFTLPDGVLDFIAGSVAGAGQTAVGQPFDTVKTRLQIEGQSSRFKGPLDCVLQTIRKEGVLSLYKGMLSPLLGISAVNAVLFATYSRLKELQKSSASDQLKLYQIALAGGGAGAANSIIISPVELLKIRLQGQYGSRSSNIPTGPSQLARDLCRSQGLRRGLFRGFWATLFREIPANMGFYAGFEAAKRWLANDQYDANSLPVSRLLLAGACGGISYWTVCYPMDIIKSRVQFSTSPLRRPLSYIADTARQIYREGGLRAFTRGLTPTLLRSLPAAATTFSLYELSSNYLKQGFS